MLRYIMTGDKTQGLRWENRSLFLRTETSRLERNSTASVLMICYNHTEQFFRLLDKIDKESGRDQFTITIVQNSDKEEALRIFEQKIASYTNITVLYPVHNLGSAGGYALGQEYLLHHGYEHLIMVEDDIELLADDTITAMIQTAKRDEKHVVFINHPINAGGDHSRYVQLACYPLSLIRHAGIIDPRYFFRAEDLERAKRLEKHIADSHYHKVIIEKDYYHPYIKAMNNSGSWIYFSIRNQLWSFCSHHVSYVQLIRAIFFYLAFGLFVFLRTRKKEIMLCVVRALYDGIRGYRSFGYNVKIIEKCMHYKKLFLSDLGWSIEQINTLPSYINTHHLLARTTLSVQDREVLGRYRGDLRVSGGFQPVRGWYMVALQRLFIIEHLRLDKDMCSGKLLRQSFASSVLNLGLFLPAALLGGIAIIVYTVLFLPTSYLRK